MVSFDIAGTLKQKVGVALPASAAQPPKGDLTCRESFECLSADSVVGDPAAKRQLPLGSFDEEETVLEFTYLDDRVGTGGGCEAALTARTRCGWVKFRECGELLYGRRFPLELKWAVYESYIRPAILYGREAWCLKKIEMGILQWTERSMVRAICGVQLKDKKKVYGFDVHAVFE